MARDCEWNFSIFSVLTADLLRPCLLPGHKAQPELVKYLGGARSPDITLQRLEEGIKAIGRLYIVIRALFG